MIFRALGMDVDDEEAIFVHKDYISGNKWETKYEQNMNGMAESVPSR